MLWIPAALAGSVQIQVNSASGRRRRKFQRIASSVPSLPKLFDPKWPKKLILRFLGIGSGDAFLFKQSSARRCGLSNGDDDPWLAFVKGADARASPIVGDRRSLPSGLHFSVPHRSMTVIHFRIAFYRDPRNLDLIGNSVAELARISADTHSEHSA